MFIDECIDEMVNAAFRRSGGQGDAVSRVIRPRPDEQLSDYVDAILSRYTVFDLREISGEEVEAATARLERSEGFIGVVRSGVRNMIAWFEVASGDRVYEIRRFETFWFCSCPGFTFSKTCCKHIAFINSQQTRKVTRNERSAIGSQQSERTNNDRFAAGEIERPFGQTGSAFAGRDA